jgi:predicted small lipoprotein YifL
MRKYFLACVAVLSLFAISLTGCGEPESAVIEAPVAAEESDTPDPGMDEEAYAAEMEKSMTE